MAAEEPEVVVPGVDAWEAWRPEDLAARLDGIGVPWCVAAGWALDLWHARETRQHEDLEIATIREHFDAFRRRFSDCDFFTAGSGEVHPLLPDSPPSLEHHQNWVLERLTRKWRLDIFLEPGDDETWQCRRAPTLRFPRSEVTSWDSRGIPYLRPEFVLLFKARAAREKDEADLNLALPRLDSQAKMRLRAMLELVHPGHVWIERL